jgi:acetyl-CoA synthetase (ADP-forming)
MLEVTEKEAEDFLEKQGFNIVARKIIRNKSEIDKVAIDFPWVMKASGKKINHKKKVGAVILDIKDKKQAHSIFDKLSKIQGKEEIIIQKQLQGQELILGLKDTPEFGLVILLGKGGSNVEKEKDVSFRATPIDKNEAEKMFSELKCYGNIKTKINQKELIKNVLKLSKLAEKYKSKIHELDINPIIINKTQAVIIDARIVFS